MAVRSKETIFNAAIYRCGLRPSDQTGVWEAMEANYDEIVRAAFEDTNGRVPFGMARTTLTSRSAGDFGFDDAYTLPADVIQIVEVYLDTYSASDLMEEWQYDAQNSKLHLDDHDRTVEIEYVKEGLEHTWSANFALGIQRRLEAIIKAVQEEEEESSVRDEDGSYYMLKASVKGATGRSKGRVWKKSGGRIIRARRAPFRTGGR